MVSFISHCFLALLISHNHSGHPHEALCHAPSTCSQDLPCPAMVDVSCACGNVKKRVLCGSCTNNPISSAAKELKCTDACAVIKRNLALAQALGIEQSRTAVNARRQVEYPPEILSYFGQHRAWCIEQEAVLASFIASGKATHLFPAMKQPQRTFIHEVAELWNIKAESLDAEPHRRWVMATLEFVGDSDHNLM